jgi:transketolase
VLETGGHDMRQIISTLEEAQAIENKPVMVIAHTIPGKGVDYMENDYHWHGNPPGTLEVPGDPDKKDQVKVALHDLRTLRGRIRGEHE